jgi:hypothetical protein
VAVPIEPLTDPAPAPDDFTDAVILHLNSALVAPGLLTWAGLDLAEPGTGLPYAVVLEPDESDSALNTEGDQLADGHLAIACYAASKKEARLAGDRVSAALQDAALAFAAGDLVFLRQESRSAALDPDPAPGGGDCWQESRVFHFQYSYGYASE